MHEVASNANLVFKVSTCGNGDLVRMKRTNNVKRILLSIDGSNVVFFSSFLPGLAPCKKTLAHKQTLVLSL